MTIRRLGWKVYRVIFAFSKEEKLKAYTTYWQHKKELDFETERWVTVMHFLLF